MSKVAVFQDTPMALFQREEPPTPKDGDAQPAVPKEPKLIWRPERDRLAKARRINCEVPELLIEILEHNYDKSWEEAPGDPIEIRYYWRRSDRGAAWDHLMRNPPIIEVVRGRELERFKPLFEPKRHPYRKNHGPNYWAWYVTRWELVPPEEEEDEDHQRGTDRS
jgi:hypothetical protein